MLNLQQKARVFQKAKGFTLLEVLVAIAIFSVISLSSFTIFNTVLTSDEISKLRNERMNELQRAFILIERDFLQIAQRRMRLNGEAASNNFIHTDLSGIISTDQAIGFVRNGWTNPGLLMPRSDMQSVAYHLNEDVLERLHFNFVDSVLGEEPKVRKLITGVTALKFEFYDGEKWQNVLAGSGIPLAIAIEIETEDYGIIRRQFLVAGDRSAGSGKLKAGR